MSDSFKEAMEIKTDRELVSIIYYQSEDYQPRAVEVAREELKRRNIDHSQIEELREEMLMFHAKSAKEKTNNVSVLNRIINFVFDSIAILIIDIIVVLLLSPSFTYVGQDLTRIVFTLCMIVVFFAYYMLFEFHYQRTLGKFVTGTRVVNKFGDNPSVSDVLARTFLRLIPFDNISFLFPGNGFHDWLSDTKVIYNKPSTEISSVE